MKIRIAAILLLITSSAYAETISARQQNQDGSWGDIVIELNYDENVSSNILATSLGEGAPTASEAGFKQALALRFVQYNSEEEGWDYLPPEQGGLQVLLSIDPYDKEKGILKTATDYYIVTGWDSENQIPQVGALINIAPMDPVTDKDGASIEWSALTLHTQDGSEFFVCFAD